MAIAYHVCEMNLTHSKPKLVGTTIIDGPTPVKVLVRCARCAMMQGFIRKESEPLALPAPRSATKLLKAPPTMVPSLFDECI